MAWANQADFKSLATAYYLSQVNADDGAPHMIRVNNRLYRLIKNGDSVNVEEM